MPAPPLTDKPSVVLDVLERDRHVHPYGIYDVVNLWHRSRWWVRGHAVVGLITLPGSSEPVVYAVPATARTPTLDLLVDLIGELPPRLIIHGPDGVTDRLAQRYRTTWSAPHFKMHLARPALVQAPDPDARVLGAADVPRLGRLFAADPHPGTFFHDGLVASGHYVGIDDGRDVVAVCGVHLVDPRCGVAAIGNVTTHPAHRRRGLARRAIAALCHRLLGEVDVIGLNVRRDNLAAQALYASLGFVQAAEYEEAQLTES
jgi:ribosomal protein S18 acetylase RimI-like enzyme